MFYRPGIFVSSLGPAIILIILPGYIQYSIRLVWSTMFATTFNLVTHVGLTMIKAIFATQKDGSRLLSILSSISGAYLGGGFGGLGPPGSPKGRQKERKKKRERKREGRKEEKKGIRKKKGKKEGARKKKRKKES